MLCGGGGGGDGHARVLQGKVLESTRAAVQVQARLPHRHQAMWVVEEVELMMKS